MAATICPRPVTLTFDLEVGVGVACAKMLRIDAFVIRRSRFIQIFSSLKQVFYVTIKRYNTHSLTAALDQLRVVASSTSNDPGP